jgi:hypothetical protein
MECDRRARRRAHRLPGWIATALLALASALWTLWGVGEMYYEGWWGAWTNRLPYLVPPLVCITFAIVALTWPQAGGWIVLLAGGAFTAWRWERQAQLGLLTVRWALGWFPVSGAFVVAGALFVLEGRYRRKRRAEGRKPCSRWLPYYVVALAPAMLTAIGVTAVFAPLLLLRYDDGERGARQLPLTGIDGESVTLIWAPAGPGWNGHPLQGVGRYPSWDDLAFYGMPPVGIHPQRKWQEGKHATQVDMQATGLCRYLSADGTTLLPEPQDQWRLPTTDEIVRSLVRQGERAGCTWDGHSARAECERQPNKDAPLWAPDEAPVYYWASDEYDQDEAWYVPYTGGGPYGGRIGHQHKSWGNARHGYRCVRAL